jgi:hypothetical protein
VRELVGLDEDLSDVGIGHRGRQPTGAAWAA